MSASLENRSREFFRNVLHVFAFLCVLFIPIHVVPFQDALSHFLFRDALNWFAQQVCGFDLINPDLSSDSTLLYLLFAFLFLISFIIAVLLARSSKWTFHREEIFVFIRKVLCFYLALQLSEYGADKLFKSQFYQPEPNILYTPFGKLDQDILFWSWMGTSYSYNVFLGCTELVAAALLLFRRTRTLGLLLALVVMSYVSALNFCFDISVKLFSLFLLFIAFFLVFPQLTVFYRFFVAKEAACLDPEPSLKFFEKPSRFALALKSFVILYILVAPAYPYVSGRQLDDDLAERPFLHGAYKVLEMQSSDTFAAGQVEIKRFFIHRDNFIIFQDEYDEMLDFKLQIDQMKNQFVLTDYEGRKSYHNYTWSEKDSVLFLNYELWEQKGTLKAKALNWRKLPALKPQFHWTSDQFD